MLPYQPPYPSRPYQWEQPAPLPRVQGLHCCCPVGPSSTSPPRTFCLIWTLRNPFPRALSMEAHTIATKAAQPSSPLSRSPSFSAAACLFSSPSATRINRYLPTQCSLPGSTVIHVSTSTVYSIWICTFAEIIHFFPVYFLEPVLTPWRPSAGKVQKHFVSIQMIVFGLRNMEN